MWSDPRACRAVFWCEDHGDLAYYTADPISNPEAAAFCAGDLVQFDVTVRSDFRAASNARLVGGKVSDTLQADLKQTADRAGQMRCGAEASNIVAFNLNDRPLGRGQRRRQRG